MTEPFIKEYRNRIAEYRPDKTVSGMAIRTLTFDGEAQAADRPR